MTYEQFCKKIGGLIRFYRLKKGYKQKDLASELDVDYQHIQKLENGNNLPLFYNMLRIVQILDIPGNKIFGTEADNIDLQELSKKYSKYDNIIAELEKSKKLQNFITYYTKNSSKLENLNLISVIDALSKVRNKKKTYRK